jgi:hypothetical protein
MDEKSNKEVIEVYLERFRVMSLPQTEGDEPKIAFVGAKVRPSVKRAVELVSQRSGIKKSTLISEAIEMYLELVEGR